MRGAVHFDWDSENGRIARLHHKADLLTPLLELLGSLEEVSSVFENALVIRKVIGHLGKAFNSIVLYKTGVIEEREIASCDGILLTLLTLT
ncbi:hypothetical protein GQ600_24580 [Phytophthora cactorum]|nr:hypothetical protein GQ600_24580 [Phytophthora cactorum]